MDSNSDDAGLISCKVKTCFDYLSRSSSILRMGCVDVWGFVDKRLSERSRFKIRKILFSNGVCTTNPRVAHGKFEQFFQYIRTVCAKMARFQSLIF